MIKHSNALIPVKGGKFVSVTLKAESADRNSNKSRLLILFAQSGGGTHVELIAA